MDRAPVLSMCRISKEFPGVKALAGVDFRLYPGEIHALMGENGAGKSTLIKVLTGVHSADAGRITLDGEAVSFAGPAAATHAGISTVYQEVNLCPNLSVAENIFIGREPTRFGHIRWRTMRRRAAELLRDLQLDLDVTAQLDDYPIAIQQMVAIARAVDVEAKVLVLDEPTSSLDQGEVDRLFRVMRRLREQGIAILFVSHFLDQVYEICDRMTVLRNGTVVGEHRVGDLPQLELVGLMLGKELDSLDDLPRHRPDRAEPVVVADGLGRSPAVEPFSLTIHKGEVVGLAGLLGSGRTEIARLLFGADRPDTGRLTVKAAAVTPEPHEAVRRGIAFCSEDRRTEGLVEQLTVEENILLALQASRGWSRPIPKRRRQEVVDWYIAGLDIRPANPDLPVRELSGGNQQKVLLARAMLTDPCLLILDEPTRGIDVGAKAEIQRLVVELAGAGMAVVFVSAELTEILRMSHTIAVLRDRRIVARVTDTDHLDSARLLREIAG
ncbi:sugar ABC transporter ATP-binding protein [Dactylosporangium sp. NPDC005572]|uniref:sugar ABC transporter ATP-binding protein n=1 Tax=Dactylosporangium sp. NPDC005572 TaxID=3156889 RepID=UPI0033B90875